MVFIYSLGYIWDCQGEGGAFASVLIIMFGKTVACSPYAFVDYGISFLFSVICS